MTSALGVTDSGRETWVGPRDSLSDGPLTEIQAAVRKQIDWRVDDRPGDSVSTRDQRLDADEVQRRTRPELFVQKRGSCRVHVEPLEGWEGVVETIEGDRLGVRLRGLLDSGSTDEVATIEIDSVSDADRSLIAVGAVFYWGVGYAIEHGTKKLVSEIRFRRLPAWTATEIKRAEQFGSEFDEAFGEETS